MVNQEKKNNIGAEELAEELLPVLRDFFAGKFTCEANVLHCALFGGRQFKITVEEE